MIGTIPKKWKLLSGENKWHDLLSPLDTDLKNYILHNGAMAQATYDAFNSEKRSKNAGRSLFAKKNFFSRVGLVNNNPFKYKIVKFIYATSKIEVPESFMVTTVHCKVPKRNWMGFVAVATDEGKEALGRRDILVAWRGTMETSEWVKDFDSPLVPADKIAGKSCTNGYVHRGVLSIYTSCDDRSPLTKTSARDQVLSEVKKQLEIYKEEEVSITVTGHSLGAALSVMNAGDIAANGFNIPTSKPDKPCPVTAFLFACLRVGETNYCSALMSLSNLHILNIANVPDVVPTFPPEPYVSIGVPLQVDSRVSPFLNCKGNEITWHNLEGAYLHTVSIANCDFEGHRDLALVHKSSYSLKEEYPVPIFWWCLKHKGMVQKENGTWVLDDCEKDDDEEEEEKEDKADDDQV